MTDLIKRLRLDSASEADKTRARHEAADELERLQSGLTVESNLRQKYHEEVERLQAHVDHLVKGMENWKQTAQKKDEQIAKLQAIAEGERND